MYLNLKGDVNGSLAEFDKAIELDPRQKACRFSFFELSDFINVFKLFMMIISLIGQCGSCYRSLAKRINSLLSRQVLVVLPTYRILIVIVPNSKVHTTVALFQPCTLACVKHINEFHR